MGYTKKKTVGFSREKLSNLLAIKADMDMAVAYAMVFWPQFIMYQDLVLFKYFDRRTYHEAKKYAKVASDIEKFMNHRHLCEIFGNPYTNATPDQLNCLGRILKDMWSVKLSRDFPERTFSFKQTFADKNDNFVASITFWSK